MIGLYPVGSWPLLTAKEAEEMHLDCFCLYALDFSGVCCLGQKDEQVW